MADLILEIVFNLIGAVAEAFLESFASSDTLGWRILWSIILALLGGVIWWELH